MTLALDDVVDEAQLLGLRSAAVVVVVHQRLWLGSGLGVGVRVRVRVGVRVGVRVRGLWLPRAPAEVCRYSLQVAGTAAAATGRLPAPG